MFLRWYPSSLIKVFWVLGLSSVACAGGSKKAEEPKPESVKPAPVIEISSEPTPSKGFLPSALKAVEKKYQEGKTVQADFRQEVKLKLTGQTKVSQGRILVQRPDQFRWETFEPDPNVLVSNGKVFWYYTPPFDETEAGQVIIRQGAEARSQKVASLLAGSFSEISQDRLKTLAPDRFEWNPKAGEAGDVNRVEIEVNSSNSLIKKVILEHKGGNRTELTLSQVKIGVPLRPEAFHFQIPPGTSIIRE